MPADPARQLHQHSPEQPQRRSEWHRTQPPHRRRARPLRLRQPQPPRGLRARQPRPPAGAAGAPPRPPPGHAAQRPAHWHGRLAHGPTAFAVARTVARMSPCSRLDAHRHRAVAWDVARQVAGAVPAPSLRYPSARGNAFSRRRPSSSVPGRTSAARCSIPPSWAASACRLRPGGSCRQRSSSHSCLACARQIQRAAARRPSLPSPTTRRPALRSAVQPDQQADFHLDFQPAFRGSARCGISRDAQPRPRSPAPLRPP